MRLPEVTKRFHFGGHKGAIYQLGWEGNHLYSVSGDGYLVKWKLDSGTGEAVLHYPAPLFSLAISPTYIVVGAIDGCVVLYDRASHKVSRYLFGDKPVYALEFLGDKYLLIGEGSGCLHLFHLGEKKVDFVWKSDPEVPLRCVAHVDDMIIVGGYDGYLFGLRLPDFQAVYSFQAHQKTIFTLRRCGELVWSGGRDAYLKGWLWKTGEKVVEIPAHYFTVNSIAIDEEQRFLFTGSRDKTIRVWDLETRQLMRVIDYARRGGHQASVNTLLFLQDKGLLVSAGDDRQIMGWHVERISG